MPKKEEQFSGNVYIDYEIFGVFYNNSMYYLPCNPNIDVTIQNMDSPVVYHRRISNTKIPNLHFGGIITGLRIGNFFWILGGTIAMGESWENLNPYTDYPILPKTSLWVIEKATWIIGPELPQFFFQVNPFHQFGSHFCATSVNSTTAYFFFIGKNGISRVVTYNIMHNIWTILPQKLSIGDCPMPWCWGLCTCTSSQTKLGKR